MQYHIINMPVIKTTDIIQHKFMTRQVGIYMMISN